MVLKVNLQGSNDFILKLPTVNCIYWKAMKISNHLNMQQYIPTTGFYAAMKKSKRQNGRDKLVNNVLAGKMINTKQDDHISHNTWGEKMT